MTTNQQTPAAALDAIEDALKTAKLFMREGVFFEWSMSARKKCDVSLAAIPALRAELERGKT